MLGLRARRRTSVAIALGITVGVALPATGHYANFSGSIYQTRFVPWSETRCLLSDADTCSVHSWTFASAKNLTNDVSYVRAVVDPLGSAYDVACAAAFVRNCLDAYQHGAALDCHDQDSNDDVRVRAHNPTADDLTIQMHGGY
jgi:hypothetical protein